MSNTIKLKCNSCQDEFEIDLQDYDLSWEVVDTFDHGDNAMGEEIHHEAVIEVDGHSCGENEEPIVVTLGVWEYPIGAFNYQEIEVEGAEMIEGCDLQDIAPIGDIEQ